MKKEKNAAKPKTKRPAKPKKEPVSQWMTNPLNEQVLDYHNYEMTQGEQVLYFILAFLIGGVVSQFFYGGLFQEDGAPYIYDVELEWGYRAGKYGHAEYNMYKMPLNKTVFSYQFP